MKNLGLNHTNWWFFTIILLIAGCDPQLKDSSLTAITVYPAQESAPFGLSLQFKAVGIYSGNQNLDITKQVFWSTSNIHIATIANSRGKKGLVQTAGIGKVAIIATDPENGVSGATVLSIKEPAIMKIEVEPAAAYLHLGQVQQFKAVGISTDGSRRDVTDRVTWSSPEAAAPTVSNAVGSKGLSISPPSGTITIAATEPDSGITGTASLSLSSAKLRSIKIQPDQWILPTGADYTFKATGIYEDGSSNDISDTVIWASTDPEIAAAVNLPNEIGRIIAKKAGKTRIKATDPKFIIIGIADLTVGAASLKSIRIPPPPAEIFVRKSIPLSAEGVYSDGQVKDFTQNVIWKSSKQAVAAVDNNQRKGTITAGSAGKSVIKVVEPETGLNAAVSIVVSVPRITAIEINPVEISCEIKGKVTFKAVGIYSDGERKDVTDLIEWSSSNDAVAKIAVKSVRKGIAEAVAPGKATITARKKDKRTDVQASSELKVLPSKAPEPKAMGIRISPESPVLPLGCYLSLSAKCLFDDGTSRIITDRVQWRSASPKIATVRDTIGAKGLINSKSIGLSVISIHDPVTGIHAKTTATIKPPSLAAIRIQPKTNSILLDRKAPFTAIGNYSNGKTADLTSNVVWGCSDESIIVIDNQPGSKGLATAKSVGECEIIATEPESGKSARMRIVAKNNW